jgi:hypothetical protein
MANPHFQPYSAYQSQIDSLGRQKDFTQSLMAQALAPQENQTAATGLARVLATYLAKKGMTKADTQQQDLIKQQNEARRQELSRVLSLTQDRAAETAQPNVVGPPAPARKAVSLDLALMQSNIPEFQDMGLKRSLDTKAASGGDIGTYNPRDYTESSFSKFIVSRNPADLKRYAPQRNVDIGGVPHVFDPAEGIYVPATLGGGGGGSSAPPAGGGVPGQQPPAGKQITAEDVANNRAIIVEKETEARERGESQANQELKYPVLDSMNYVMAQYEELFPKLSTGGPMGIAGKVSSVLDSQDVMRFENLNQQLSTDLRTVYRIPGEGPLSDQEQKQYGLQLPSIHYDEKTNRAIIKDLNTRTRLRLSMPVDDAGGQGGQGANQQVTQTKTQTTGGGGGGFKLLNVRPK